MDIKETKVKVSPKHDVVFKLLFGQVGSEEILKDFLESIIKIKINKVELDKETILLPEELKKRGGIVDIRAIINDSINVCIEMQNYRQECIESRLEFYSSKLFLSSIKKGDDYKNFSKVIIIFILDYTEFNNLEEYSTKWLVTEQNFKKLTLDMKEFHIIELEKFRKSKVNKKDKLEQWLTFIDYKNKEEIDMIIKENERIKEANDKFQETMSEGKLRYLAELEEIAELDRRTNERVAREKGMELGIQKTKKLTAKKMLQKNMSIKLIIDLTGLTLEEIEKLRKDSEEE